MSGVTVDFMNKADTPTNQVTGDYVTTPAEGIFTVSPPELTAYDIGSISVDMRLASTVDATKYGVGTELTTGITIYADIDGTVKDLCPGNIKTNEDLEKYFIKTNKLLDSTLMGVFRIYFDFTRPITLNQRKGKAPDRLIIKSVEDLDTARFVGSTMSFRAHGMKRSI
jgi:hypothetical protein